MISKRRFLGCALCAALGLTASGAQGQAPAGGPVRTELRRTDYPNGHVVIQMILEAPAGLNIARHTHPGVESSYVLEGEVELAVQGQATRTYKAGEAFQVPAGVPHGGVVGGQKAKLHITYIVEKDKPLAAPA